MTKQLIRIFLSHEKFVKLDKEMLVVTVLKRWTTNSIGQLYLTAGKHKNMTPMVAPPSLWLSPWGYFPAKEQGSGTWADKRPQWDGESKVGVPGLLSDWTCQDSFLRRQKPGLRRLHGVGHCRFLAEAGLVYKQKKNWRYQRLRNSVIY